MIVGYIRYRIPEDEARSFEDAYRAAAPSLDASPHCERYEVARCAEDATAYTVRIEWDSADGHLQGFRGSWRRWNGSTGSTRRACSLPAADSPQRSTSNDVSIIF